VNKITEIIRDDMPEWAQDAIDNGNFFSVAIAKVESLEKEVKDLNDTLDNFGIVRGLEPDTDYTVTITKHEA